MYDIVMNLEQDEYEISLAERFKRHAQDFNDLQNEMAGNDVGRISRFLTGDEHGPRAAEKHRAKREAVLSNLQIMMSDPEYAKFYRETEQKLRDTQSSLDTALDMVLSLKAETEAILETALENAAQLPNGERVYKDQNGQVRFEDGTPVADDQAATVVWTGSELSLEEMQAQKTRLEGLTGLEGDFRAGQAKIVTCRTRWLMTAVRQVAKTKRVFRAGPLKLNKILFPEQITMF